MANTGGKRKNLVAFVGALTLSAGLMLWLLWRFPVGTCTVTLFVLAAFVVSARLTRAIDENLRGSAQRNRG